MTFLIGHINYLLEFAIFSYSYVFVILSKVVGRRIPTSFDASCPENPSNYPQHTAQSLQCQKLESLDYIFAADSIGLM